MSVDRTEGRRTKNRAFRPTLDGELETRELLSKLPGTFFLNHPRPGVAYKNNNPNFLSAGADRFPVASFPRGKGVATQTAHGGQTVIVAAPDGSHFKISLTQFIPPAGEGQTQSAGTSTVPGSQNPIQGSVPGGSVTQPIGTVRAYAMTGGKVGLIVDGSTTQTELDISPLPFPQRRGYAHSFAYGQTNQSHVLNIGQITINSGEISAILGYHTADLSGPLIIKGNTAVDRIAFQDLLPGAFIYTGSDLNTLDVLNSVNLNSGLGIVVGRDLNLLNVGQDLDLSNGASVIVKRFLGANPQPPKGTASGSNILALNQALVGTGTSANVPALAGYIQGDLHIGAGSQFHATDGLAKSSFLGTTTTQSGTQTPLYASATFLINGTLTISGNDLNAQVVSPDFNPFVFGTNIGEIPPNSGSAANFIFRGGVVGNTPFP